MIELFKILKGIYDTSCVPQFGLVQLSEDNLRTRGNNYKLIQHHCHYDLTRKLCCRKDDRAMHPIYGCHENFLDSLTMHTATFPKIFHGLLF